MKLTPLTVNQPFGRNVTVSMALTVRGAMGERTPVGVAE
jgi:hypothetical protein